jgi:prepilin signal peptidase PulO-like enzyme (type II secretory pathway)
MTSPSDRIRTGKRTMRDSEAQDADETQQAHPGKPGRTRPFFAFSWPYALGGLVFLVLTFGLLVLGVVSVELVQAAVLVVFALTTIVTDWREQRIYNITTFPTIVAGLALSAFQGIPGEIFSRGLIDHVVAGAVIFAVFYPTTVAMGWMKAGDLKFLMAIGALMGTWFLLGAFIYGSIIGGALAVGFGLVKGRWRGVLMPYGIALAAGSLVALVGGVPRY